MDTENEAPPKKVKRMKPKVVKEWSEDDIFKLINLVEQNFCLWNAADEGYHNKVFREIAWQKIEDNFSGKFGMGDVQAKWTNLRIQFRGYLSRAKTKSGQGAADTPKWKSYNAMAFVGRAEDQQTQPTTSNLSIDDNSESNSIDNSTPTSPSPASGTTKKRPHAADSSSPAAQIAETMREAVATLRARNENSSGPNVTFTNYMLSELNTLSEQSAANVRNKVAMYFLQTIKEERKDNCI